MRVLIVRGFPEKLNLSGYNVQETGLASALRRKGMICDIVFFGGKEPDHVQQLADGTKIYWLHGKNIAKNGIMPGVRKLADGYDVIQVHEYDQLQSWLSYTFWKKPVVVYHGPYYDAFNRGYNAKCRVFDHSLLLCSGRAKRSVHCLAKSPLAAKFLQDKGFRHVLSVGVGFDAAAMDTVVESSPVSDAMPDDKINLFYVGKLEERRNIPFLLKVIEKVSEQREDLHATVVGTGDAAYVAKVQPAMRRLEERGVLTYIPKAQQRELASAYRKADIFLFPTNYDIFGMVLLEAMYYGCVCVSSENGGSTTLIYENNGIVIRDFEAASWASRIMDLVKDPQRMQRMKEAATATVRDHFQWDALADQFIRTYEEAVGSRD